MLRDYQQACVDSVYQAWDRGQTRPAVVLATGAGKTIIFSAIAVREVMAGHKVLVIVDRDDLVRQTCEKLVTVGNITGTRRFTITIYQGSHKDLSGDVVVASVQTLSRARNLSTIASDLFSLVIVDEAHVASAASYQRTLEWLEVLSDQTRALGATATPIRSDKLQFSDTWPEIVYRRDILDLIQSGHLVDVRAIQVRSGVDLKGVKMSKLGGTSDFAAGDLGRALEDSDALDAMIRNYREHAAAPSAPRGVRRAVAFCPTVEVAEHFAQQLRDQGLRADTVVGTTTTTQRQSTYARLAAHEIDVITGVAVFSKGWDLPATEVALMLRPTKSIGNWIQQCGRVLRPSPETGKKEALILFLGSEVKGLAVPSDLSPSTPRDGESLTEARDREALEGEAQPREITWSLEEGESVEVDLFGRGRGGSKLAWLTTPGGTRFLQVGERGAQALVFVSEREPGSFVAARWDDGMRWPVRLARELGPLDLASARSVAEEAALAVPGYSPMRSASRRSREPSEAQERYADSLGVWVPGMTAGECGDAVTVARVGRRLDGVVDHGRASAGVQILDEPIPNLATATSA